MHLIQPCISWINWHLFVRWLCLISFCSCGFTQATQISSLTQQDSLSQWALSHPMQDSKVYRASSSPGNHKCLPVCDRWPPHHQGDSELCSKIFSSIYQPQYLFIYFFSFCCDNYSGLTGVDWSVVCPLIELICLWGCCSGLSQVLKCDGCELFVNTTVVVICISLLTITLHFFFLLGDIRGMFLKIFHMKLKTIKMYINAYVACFTSCSVWIKSTLLH